MKSEEESTVSKPSACLGVRHAQALLLFLAMLIAYGMRVNMSMAIVSMTDSDLENSFDWSSKTQSLILSSFFWGYAVLQVPGGEMAARFGGKVLVLTCIVVNSAVSLLIPIGAFYGGWQMVCACRVIQGLSQGFLVPSMHHLIGKWFPLEEKSRFGTFVHSGGQLGTAVQLMISGFISSYWGWPAIFYVNGTIGAVWAAVYVFLGSSTPQTSKVISDEEKMYILTSLGHVGEQKKLKTPWKAIFKSVPFIALIVAHSGQNWGFWTLMTEIPSYMKQVMGVDIGANGVMSALPYLTMYLLSFPLGYLVDLIQKKKWLSITACRKISNTIGHWGPAVALIGLTYAPAGDATTAVIILCVVVGLNAGQYTGYLLVHIDMAPNFGGTLMGITNCIANFVSILAPLVAGLILTDQTDPDQWRIVFYLSSAVYIVCNLIFIIFGTSERQAWNEPESKDTDDDITTEKKVEKVV
ncbi:putative inorganic phosphate cotransporter [Ostrinia nubilalis]|uniref:putative inorganic phosphate cotransporter n=1 Tax=Ostrinia nubilalis TaxID=29057 RepID=UPI0030825C07